MLLRRYETSYWPLVAGAYTVRSWLAQPGGLDGTYFAGGAFTRALETRQDEQVKFDWGAFQYNAWNKSLPGDASRNEPKVPPSFPLGGTSFTSIRLPFSPVE